MVERNGLEFGVYYSLTLCEMHARFWGRADKWLSFLQIALGSAVFASVGDTMVFGGLLVAMTAFTFVWQPGVTAMKFAMQRQKYQELAHKMVKLSDEELSAAISDISENDPSEFGLLTNPAEARASIRMRGSPNIELTIWEKIMAWLAGDLPSVNVKPR